MRFPDGAHFRIEIPSVEGPAVLAAVVAEAQARGVTVNRVSQGSGAMLLTAAELAEMARIGADNGIEVSLFVGPREEWDIGRAAHSDDGPGLAGRLRGTRQLRYAIDDILRAADQGIRGFLIADHGLLQLVAEIQAAGQLPASIVWKVSAVLAPSNPLSFGVLEQLGGTTINVPSDLTLGQLAEMRAASSVPIDLYVETPDWMGGVVRGHEAADLIRVAAPMYVKFGLRNSRLLYPSGAAPGRRGRGHRHGEGAPGRRRGGVDRPQRPGAGPVRARAPRASGSRSLAVTAAASTRYGQYGPAPGVRGRSGPGSGRFARRWPGDHAAQPGLAGGRRRGGHGAPGRARLGRRPRLREGP